MLIRKTLSWVPFFKILIEWLHFRPLVLISALADCKCYFYSRGPNCKQNLAVPDSSETARFFFFLDFYTSYEASIASPCVVLWEIKRKRAFPKALRLNQTRERQLILFRKRPNFCWKNVLFVSKKSHKFLSIASFLHPVIMLHFCYNFHVKYFFNTFWMKL